VCAGIIIAFTYGWDMTLVMLSCMPFLAAAGAWIAKVQTDVTKLNADSYAEVRDTLGMWRDVKCRSTTGQIGTRRLGDVG
jgi:ABC-type multidrug transport system fused ATPase/permease subunit